MCGCTNLVMVTTDDFNQIQNKNVNDQENENGRLSYSELKDRLRNRAQRYLPTKEELLLLAKKLEDDLHPKEHICTQICKDFDDIVSDKYIRNRLPEEYKQKSKIRQGNLRNGSANEDKRVTEQSDEEKDQKKVTESIETPASQKILERFIITNGGTEPSLMDPAPLVAEYTGISRTIQQQEQEEIKRENPLQSVVDRLESERKEHLRLIEQLRDKEKQKPKQEPINSKVKIPANDLMKILINRAIKAREPYVERPIDENGIVQLPTVNTTS